MIHSVQNPYHNFSAGSGYSAHFVDEQGTMGHTAQRSLAMCAMVKTWYGHWTPDDRPDVLKKWTIIDPRNISAVL